MWTHNDISPSKKWTQTPVNERLVILNEDTAGKRRVVFLKLVMKLIAEWWFLENSQAQRTRRTIPGKEETLKGSFQLNKILCPTIRAIVVIVLKYQ